MGDIPDRLNPEQHRAVEYGDGPLLILAGAGTGKTTVITERLAWLIVKQGLKPEEVLALTFTEKAAGEMEDRVDRLLPYGYSELWISTFHTFGERILKAHGLEIGLAPDFDVVNETQQWLLLREHLDDLPLDYYRPLGNPTKFLQALVRHFSRLKDEGIPPEEYLAYAEQLRLNHDREPATGEADESARIAELAQCYHVYQRLLRDAGALDFGDLIVETLRLLRERPAILARYREQFQHLLIDEFQDTNWAQYELIKLLAAPRNNLTVVGDDDQSIYKFRGASIANILTFKQDFPTAATVVLTQNYRGRQNLLDAAYNFIQKNNPNRLEAALAENHKPLGQAITKRLTAVESAPGSLEVVTAATDVGEAKEVVDRIVATREREGLTWNDFAILVRANDHATPFLAELDSRGVPAQFLASQGLFRKPEILDLIAYLKLLDNYHESPALFRVLSIPLFGVPANDLVELTHAARAKTLSLYETLKIAPTLTLSTPTQATVAKLLGWIDKHTEQARRQSVQLVLYDVLTDLGLLAAYTAKDDRASQERVLLLNQFFKVVAEFERTVRDPSVRAFVQHLDLAMEAGDEGRLTADVDEGPESVKVMTVHAAKGLEFAHVSLVQLVEQRFPSRGRRDAIEVPDALVREPLPEGDVHLQEERRLFYVGLTRAKRGLVLSWAKDYGGTREKKPSLFLVELGLVPPPPARVKAVAPSRLQPPPPVPVSHEDPVYRRLIEQDNDFSFSKLSTYERCPWQYRYAYVLKVPARPSFTASFGTTLHATLQEFYQRIAERASRSQASLFDQTTQQADSAPLVTLDELLEIYERQFVTDWYPSRAHLERFRAKGRDVLQRFYEHRKGHFQPAYALEQGFHLNVGDVRLSGRIDRIDRAAGDSERPAVEIIDYKSGKAKDKLATDDKFQLLIYYAAASDPSVLNLDVKKLTYLYLDDDTTQSLEPTPADVEAVQRWAGSIVAKVKAADFRATPSAQVCRHCDYRAICPFRDVR